MGFFDKIAKGTKDLYEKGKDKVTKKNKDDKKPKTDYPVEEQPKSWD
jgi:hypothetical protein